MVTKILFVVCAFWISMPNAAPPDGSLVMDVYPGNITLGLTNSMTVNCSFSFAGITDIDDLISITIAKENSQMQFEDLASLNIFAPNDLKTAALLNGTSTVSGCIKGDGQSYLAIHWSFPTSSEGGVYRCEVNGLDSTGHPTQKSQTIMVTSQSASFDQLITKVSDLQSQLDRQETLSQNQSQTIDKLVAVTQTQANMISEQSNKISEQSNMISEQKTLNQNQSQTIDTLLSLTQTQSNMISELSATLSNYTNTCTDQQINLNCQRNLPVELAFSISTEYQGHYYLVSKADWKDSRLSEQTCEDYGGYLVELNNSEEHQFVKGFLDSLDGFNHVLISGTDEGHSGQWTYTYSGGPLTYADWYGSEPNDANNFCIEMYRGYSWQWGDYHCTNSHTNWRFRRSHGIGAKTSNFRVLSYNTFQIAHSEIYKVYE